MIMLSVPAAILVGCAFFFALSVAVVWAASIMNRNMP